MPRNRLQYSLAFGSSHEFKVELANLPVTNNTQIMLYTDGLIGSIQIQATLCVNNKSDQL